VARRLVSIFPRGVRLDLFFERSTTANLRLQPTAAGAIVSRRG